MFHSFTLAFLLLAISLATSSPLLEENSSSSSQEEEDGVAAADLSDDPQLFVDENRTFMRHRQNTSGGEDEDQLKMATCYDPRLAKFINVGLAYYSHNMDQLASYVLNQIEIARYSGYWFVHAAIIAGQRQGVQWQSKTNGDIFGPSSHSGCYYYDTQTYLIILHY